MALAGRSTRRGNGRRWLVVGVIVTLLILLVDASVKSRSPGPGQRLAGDQWVDRAYQLVGDSNVAGRDLSALLSSTDAVTASAVTSEVSSMASSAGTAFRELRRLRPPSDLQDASSLLYTCLLVRSQATVSIKSVVDRELRTRSASGTPNGAGAALARAVDELQVADSAYRLFTRAVPSSLDAPAPASRWITSDGDETSADLAVFLAGLRSRVSLAPTHRLAIEALSTVPAALTSKRGVETLSASPDLTAVVVVGNPGNQPEDDVTVTASISLVATGGTSSAREFVDTLAPGASQTVTIGYLNPEQGVKVDLTVTVTPAAGSPAQAQTDRLAFEMPSTSSSTTSTTAPSTTATSTTTTSTSSLPAGG